MEPIPWDGLTGAELYAACLDAAREGDRRALDRLVAELTPLVWQVARGNGLERQTAEDVVQTVWLSLFKHLGQLKEPRALAGWLITTTRRESRRSYGRRPPVVPLTDELAEAVPDERQVPETEVLRAERDRQVWDAFGELPPRCQELLRLTVLAGRAHYRAVAEALHMPRGSIGPSRGRCLKTLRELLTRPRRTR